MIHRINKLRNKMKEANLDAFLVTSSYNLRYVSGFTGTSGLAVITLDNAYFVTDFRYTEQASTQCEGYTIVQHSGPIYDEVENIVKKENLSNMAFEEVHMSYFTHDVVSELLSCDMVPVQGMIEELREVKESSEIEIVKAACGIADKAYAHILDYIKPGMSEIQVANEVDFFMRSLGATSVSFETIVASGVRSAMPHGVASNKIIEQGDLITLDFGCYYEGYVSDMTRTFAIGDPGQQLKDIHQMVLDAQLMVTAAAKPGMTGVQLDAVARDYFATKGVAEAFGHSTGHGIGLEIHEGPNVSRLAEKAFVPGNIISNEPGLYFPGIGGVRIEDDLLVTETGVEILTHSPRELIIL
ncbi:M24 family metallopeptidase [Vagococcus xieshaowenii]|uniref:Aminopeptidase P family protein n=1 Tax=Vagococcus xieshaowenii TaxID=2562451 RepID=A0AAJ5EEW7_9ENTE|nr:Xaa-Pro peptidase family protein [Vagococcus xieshaowenii]QCA28281.1 aminopeptidase P family protein [Vagococcus xieshaowenii]TFZ42331.1 aminopeptidase P family protein [Vagococcus xieshaowenii]